MTTLLTIATIGLTITGIAVVLMRRIPDDDVDEFSAVEGVVPPAFFDDGYDGAWAEFFVFPHSFEVSDYAGRQLADRTDFAPVASFHADTPSAPEGAKHA